MSDWQWDYEAFGELLCGPEMQALMGDRIDKAAAAARAIAPVGDPAAWADQPTGAHPGLYRDSFETSTGVEAFASGPRAYGRLTNTAPYAAAVEWGNSRSPAQHVMAKALDFMQE